MNPVIFLWAHPRSMSTVIERIMRERGDFDCLHEPFLQYFYLQRSGKRLPHFEGRQNFPDSYAQTRDLILQRAEQAPVFAKDMSYYVMPEILQDREFCTRVRHCFLIRNPLHSILSYYRLDAEVTLEEIGIESQWRQWQGLQALGLGDSVVLEAESVQQAPVAQMRRFWARLGLDDRAAALCWDAASTPQDWQYVQGWHQQAIASNRVNKLTAADSKARQVEFEQLSRSEPRLLQYLQHHLPFYQALRQHRLHGDPGEH